MSETNTPTGVETDGVVGPDGVLAPENAKATPVPAPKEPSRWHAAGRKIVQGSVLTSILAFVIALLVGAILIVLSSEEVRAASGYFFAQPGDTLAAIWDSVSGAYSALFRGSIFSPTDPDGPLAPLGDTLKQAAPLIIGGLGLGIGFRAGLFNIGGQGQIVIGSLVCGYIGFGLPLPAGLHVVAAVMGALVGGAAWGFIPGILRAKTGANEVIVTIMLNSIALAFNDLILNRVPAFQERASIPSSPVSLETARFPYLFGPSFTVDLGFLVAIVCAVGVWWLMDRSVFGFRMRAVGENPEAARTAGIKVENVYLMALVISGALLGLVAATQLLAAWAPLRVGSGGSVAATLGFDAITVALLGRSKPLGTVLAGLLFGALSAGGRAMQTMGTPIDVILVLESVVVLFIAAPPLVRAIFRLPDPERKPSRRKLAKLAAAEGVGA